MVVYIICDSEYARHYLLKQEVAAQTYSVKKTFLEISENSQENACASVPFLIKLQAQACNFIKKETLAQVFSCEFCKIFKSTISYRTPLVSASLKPIFLSLHFS